MPSNKKKQSRSASRSSSLDPSASPQTPSPAPLDVEFSEERLVDALEEASKRFPCLISKSAVVGRVNDVDPDVKGCKVWLSEPFMVASSITPGSLVSLCLVSLRNQSFQSFPLSSFSGEYAKNKGVDLGDSVANQAGNYFALAKAFPSSKLLKNGVRLSSNLWYTMGCPAPTRIIFIYLMEQMSHGLNGGVKKLCANDDSHFSLQQCSELYLELSSIEELNMKCAAVSPINSSSEKSHNINENGVHSPRTPVYSKMMHSSDHELSSAVSELSESSKAKERSSGADCSVITAILEDEKSKILLQGCTMSWLYFRTLLQGNLVMVPMLSKLCIFLVVGGKRMLSSRANCDITSEIRHCLSLETSDSSDMKNHAFVMTRETRVSLCLPNKRSDTKAEKVLPIGNPMNGSINDGSIKLGGLHKEYTYLKNIIMSSTVKNTMSRFGLRPIKGVVLHGPPGTGKTSLAKLCARDAGVNLFCINGSEIFRQYYGESEQALREVFDSAGRSAPAVVFIDELDAIAPAREDGGEELSQRMVVTLLSLMDGITRNDGLLVIAATNRLDSLEPALRRHGRFDKEIELGVPSPKQRLEILSALLGQLEHSLTDMQVQQLAVATHGFVGADLAALCEEAAMICLRRYDKLKKSSENSHCGSVMKFGGCSNAALEESKFSKDIGDQLEQSNFASSSALEDGDYASSLALSRFENGILMVSFEDFEKAKEKVKPSAMREVILEVPKVKWEDIGGQKEVKCQLMEAIEWPQKHQDALDRIGTHPPRGILMFGPPGCSKTLMARAVASEAGLNFLAVKGPQLFSKWVGESEKAVRAIFAKARANAPSIIFFDEIDGLAVIRGKESDGVSVSDRVMSQLLIEMDGLQQRVGVTVIGATNRPDKIDPALLRPGRFDRLLFVGPPNETDRQEIFSIHLGKIPCSTDVSINELARLTNGCTGADISFICREAGIAAMNEDLEASEVSMRHFETAIEQVQPSEIHSYQELSIKFQRLVQSTANNS